MPRDIFEISPHNNFLVGLFLPISSFCLETTFYENLSKYFSLDIIESTPKLRVFENAVNRKICHILN